MSKYDLFYLWNSGIINDEDTIRQLIILGNDEGESKLIIEKWRLTAKYLR